MWLTRGIEGCSLASEIGAIAVLVQGLGVVASLTQLLNMGAPRLEVLEDAEQAAALANGREVKITGDGRGQVPLELPRLRRLRRRSVRRSAVLVPDPWLHQHLSTCSGASATYLACVGNATRASEFLSIAAADSDLDLVVVAIEDPGKPAQETAAHLTAAYLVSSLVPEFAEAFDRAPYDRLIARLIRHGLPKLFTGSPEAKALDETVVEKHVRIATQTGSLGVVPKAVAGEHGWLIERADTSTLWIDRVRI